MSKKLLTPVVGETVRFEHMKIHPYDAKLMAKLDNRLSAKFEAAHSAELSVTGIEADIMDWFMANWTYSFLFSALYIVAIVLGTRLMKHREPLNLRWLLIAWSGFLAVGSTLGSIRGVAELGNTIRDYGLYDSVCNPCCFYGVPGFWALAFVLSKVWELGDTAFIVLRKQPLIFLHYFHHITVLIYSWYSYSYHTAPGRWFTGMNMVVHAFMYSYYTLRAMRVRVPRPVMMGITILQLSQMVVGLFINIYAYWLLDNGYACNVTKDNVQWALLMYICYFLLFVNYFYRTYICRPRVRAAATEKTNGTAAKMNGSCGNGLSNGTTFQNGHSKKEL